MKKRILTFLLAIVMIMGMVPATALTANAASELKTSDAAVNILKEFEGFEEFEYVSGGQYYIGYGSQISQGDYPNGISKEDATALLRKHLTDVVDKAINAFTAANNINLKQNQHDALALFMYNYGSIPAALKEAVRTGKTGNEMINIWAQYYGNSPAGENFKGLINHRLAEVNMYLNNGYGYNKPVNFTYVILDLDGNEKVDATDKVIAYNYNAPMTLAEVPTVGSGKVFMGWHFDDADGKAGILGEQVTQLNDKTAGKVLVANIVKKNDESDVNYTIKSSSLVSRFYYNDPIAKADYMDQIDEKKRGEYRNNIDLEVTKEKMVDGVKWLYVKGARVSDGKSVRGWVYLGELPEADKITNTPVATATITAATLNVRAGATEGSADLGDLKKGVTVNIYEIKVEKTETGNKSWGKIIDTVDANGNVITGWINLAYAEVKETTGSNDAANGKTATVINTEEVNVRANAGTEYAKITSLKLGTKVTILETVMNNGKQWAQVQWEGLKDGYTKGWVYMYYLEVEGAEHTNPDGSTGSLGNLTHTGVVTSNINLNVRSYADVYAPRVSSLPTGTKINIYKVETSRGMKWGQIGVDQWVCLSYVKLTEVSGSGNTGTNTPGEPETLGTVTTTSLDVMQNYNANSAKIGTLKKGDVVTILEKNTEKTETGTRIWGRISKDGLEGWINLAYVDLKTVTTVAPGTGDTSSNSDPKSAVVANCLSVNVREAAGVYSAQITKLNNGTPITVYEQITHDKAPWARIKWNGGANEGWVCMYYVTMTNANAGTGTNTNGSTVNGTNSNTISATGYVNNYFLNVRGSAGLNGVQLGTLNQNAKVTIYEQVVADGMIWGRINYNNAPGWVCMSYITVESASSTGKGVMGTIARCFAAVNVRSAPGTNNALVGTIKVGSRVEVFETRQHATQMWGRVAQGWICMDYVLLDSELPPGTALDATVPTTEATVAPTEPDVTINRDNEVSYTIKGTVATGGDDLNVRNNTSSDSIRVGTVKNGEPITILAVKNNNAELWGRIDQYATAGWVNLAYVTYSVTGYINTDDQAIYADDNTFSTVKGKLSINTPVTIQKLTVNGETVYGWYQDVNTGLAGWVPMGRVSTNPVDILPTYSSSTDPVGANDAKGTTNMAITAYAATNNSKEVFYLKSGVTVYIGEIDLEAGIVWGKIMANGVEGWINLNAVTFYFGGTVNTAELNVRKAKNSADPDNILGVLVQNESVAICELSFDGNGNLWGKVVGNTNTDLNGGYVMMQYVNHSIDIQTK